MRKLIILLIFLLVSTTFYSQGVYLSIGKNYTLYKLKYSGTEKVNPLEKKGNGDSYEFGFKIPLNNRRLLFDNDLFYTVGLTLNQYNAEAGDYDNNYSWKTEYVGVKNALTYSFIMNDNIDLAVKAGLNLESIIYGSQIINNSRFNLTNQKDFSGLLLSPSLGVHAKYNLTEYGYLSLGYNYYRSINLTNQSDKKISFLTNQIFFGISFEIN